MGHEHVYETKYDSSVHWEECIICDKKINIASHTFSESWTMGDSCAYSNKLVHACSCGYSYNTENTNHFLYRTLSGVLFHFHLLQLHAFAHISSLQARTISLQFILIPEHMFGIIYLVLPYSVGG